MQSEDKNKFNKYSMLEAAERLSALGFSVIPVNYDKKPNVKAWKPFQENIPNAFQINEMFIASTYGVAIICGRVSGNMETLDEDLKYDLTGTMHEEFVALLKEIAPGLYEKLLIQKTRSGGFHYPYRCEVIEGNTKLASSPATEEEREKHPHEKEKTLFETRGEAGYIVVNPTQGYEIIQGSFDIIPTLTIEERELLLNAARSFNQCQKEYAPPKQKAEHNFKGLSSFQDYNNRGDVIALLQKHGWTFVYTKGAKTFLKRPGDTNATQSANFDKDKNWFTCFSSSTEFEPQKAYQPYAVYAVLECGGDFTKASKQLYDEGFGDRRKKISEQDIDPFFKQAFASSLIDPEINSEHIIYNSIDLLKLDRDERRYLLEPIIPRVGTGVLAGMPDTGKSQMARQFCLHIVSGMAKFLDFMLHTTHQKALYISTEDDSHSTAFLLQQQLKGLNKDATPNFSFLFADIYTQEEILFLMDKHLTENPCDLVIVDAFSDVFKGMDSNNNQAMRQTAKNFDRFAKKHQCFILFIHHVTKSGYKEAPHQMHIMGGAGLVQKARIVIQLSQDDAGIKYFTIVKGNYCPPEMKKDAMELSFDKDHFIFNRTGVNVSKESLAVNGKVKDTKFEKLKIMADEIFNNESLTHGQFVKKHTDYTGKEIAQAKRDLKAMHDFEIVVKDNKLYSLNGQVNNMDAPPTQEPDEPLPF